MLLMLWVAKHIENFSHKDAKFRIPGTWLSFHHYNIKISRIWQIRWQETRLGFYIYVFPLRLNLLCLSPPQSAHMASNLQNKVIQSSC